MMRQTLREEVFESKAPGRWHLFKSHFCRGSQALREKLINWLGGHVPVGFREAEEGRAEAWLYEYCHKDYCITDEALTPGRKLECEGSLRNYMLCCMHILSAEPLILQASPCEDVT